MISTYDDQAYPENERWGAIRKNLVSPDEIGYRKDIRSINYARALDAGIKAGLTEPSALALAACAREKLQYLADEFDVQVDERTHKQNQFGLDEVQLVARWGRDQREEVTISNMEIAEFHIPTVVQESKNAHAEQGAREQMWSLAIASHPEAGLELRRLSVSRFAPTSRDTSVLGIVRPAPGRDSQPEVLALFPITGLDLSANEQALLQQREGFDVVFDSRSKGEKIVGESTEALYTRMDDHVKARREADRAADARNQARIDHNNGAMDAAARDRTDGPLKRFIRSESSQPGR